MRVFLLAGTSSGSGKTTITLGLLAGLRDKGLKVQPFKCGPDFIDPTLHKLVTGSVSHNLDLWMMGEEACRATLSRHGQGKDIAVVEGVMGMFDGGDSSSAALAKSLGLPVLLVIDAAAAAESVAAVLKGFEVLEPSVAPVAVILNRIGSERHLEMVSRAIKEHCQAELLGYLPSQVEFSVPERHLGLHLGEENPLSGGALAQLSAAVREHVDLDRLVQLAAVDVTAPCPATTAAQTRLRLAVARDEAFSFYYEENLQLLRQAGAELLFFSPLADEGLPADIDALYLGGGYPELHGQRLSQNGAMRAAIRQWAEAGGPIYAECGGFLYLCESLLDQQGQTQPMVGLFPVQVRMQTRLASLGYRQLQLRRDCLLGPAGTVVRGHEFHYSTIGEMPVQVARLYELQDGRLEGYGYKNVLASYLHLHFASNPEVAEAFIDFCLH